MKDWFIEGFFNESTQVKRVNEDDFEAIINRDQFSHLLQKTPTLHSYVQFHSYNSSNQIVTDNNPYYQEVITPVSSTLPVDNVIEGESVEKITTGPAQNSSRESQSHSTPDSATQAAYFNASTGKFAGGHHNSYWEKKNLPTDRDGRMLAHYLNMEAYQEQMRMASQLPKKKKKITPGMVKYYKKRKEDAKRRRILMM